MSGATPKRDTLNLRIKPGDRDLIDRAASMRGETRTDFILDAARRAAEAALLDRTVFDVSPAALRTSWHVSTLRQNPMCAYCARCRHRRLGIMLEPYAA